MPDEQPERIQELGDGYALGVLEGEDRAEMEQLLAGRNPAVGAAVESARRTVALLAWAAEPVTPRPELRGRILAAVGTAKVMAIRGRYRAASWGGWAVAAGLGGVAFWLNGQVASASQDLAALRQQASALRLQLVERDRVLAVIGAGDSRSIRLVNTAPQAPQYRAYWSNTAGLVLAGSGITAPEPGRTLQLWIVPKQGIPISAGVFVPSAKGDVLLIAASVAASEAAQALAISDEPSGGSRQPTTQPGWIGVVGVF